MSTTRIFKPVLILQEVNEVTTYPSTRPSVQSSAYKEKQAAGFLSPGSPRMCYQCCTKDTEREKHQMLEIQRKHQRTRLPRTRSPKPPTTPVRSPLGDDNGLGPHPNTAAQLPTKNHVTETSPIRHPEWSHGLCWS